MTDPPAPADDAVILVTGLPRSGTSLMMQMLHAGGVPVLTDGRRPTDVGNPRGYYEYEKVKWLAADNTWLAEAHGRAVKVIAQLLPFLPAGPRYRVLFMRRDMAEVIRSQAAMLAALGGPPAGDPGALAAAFERNLAAADRFLSHHPRTTTELVDYKELLTAPEPVVGRVVRSLERTDLDRSKMVGAIDPQLYRSRSTDPAG